MTCKFKTRNSKNPKLPCAHYISGFKSEAGFCTLSRYFRCIEALQHYLPTLTMSAMKAYMQCKEKYRLQYIRGIKLHDEELPLPVKLGLTYGDFMGSRVSSDPFYLNEYKERYQIYPTDISKLKALFRATRDLSLYPKPGGISEQHISWNCGDHTISGYTDVSYDDHFNEYKLSGKPDFHMNKEAVYLQAGTYMLGNPDWEYVRICPVKMPALKTGWGKNSGETPGSYETRIYDDIIASPGKYFMGYTKKSGVFGKKFYRTEFNLEYLVTLYMNTIKEMRFVIDNNLWTRNELSCHVPTKCWYFPIKRSGVISDQIYKDVDINEAAGGMR